MLIAGKHLWLQQNKDNNDLHTLIFLLDQQLLLKLRCHRFSCAAADWLDACFHAALKTGFEVCLHLSDRACVQVCAGSPAWSCVAAAHRKAPV